MNILIINGPNLNFTGQREVDLYGNESFEKIMIELQHLYPGCHLDYFQSNHEGAIIDKLQKFIVYDGLVINPGALAHYSYAVYDALRLVSIPKVEVHLTNVFDREPFRKASITSSACNGLISGMGKYSYYLAIHWLILQK
jgi:3-dehydroquinate dehydratase II